jgi:hypothetical protein
LRTARRWALNVGSVTVDEASAGEAMGVLVETEAAAINEAP